MEPFDSKVFLKKLTARPGIYKMMNAQGCVLYVGKARSLKKRLNNYFRPLNQLDLKTQAMMRQVSQVEVTITPNENEALLLENILIKTLRPRYNIILKDDKSYTYLFLSAHSNFPRLSSHRGLQQASGEYFGPYPSAHSVYETLELLQKLFKLRQCSDVFFKNRTRPCLQYQIKRCSAPCVSYIKAKSYQEQVEYARLFLQGKSDGIIHQLADKMESASLNLAFEEAAKYRDQIVALRNIQEKQTIKIKVDDLDMVVLVSHLGVFCVEVLSIRNRIWIGSNTYFPQTPEHATEEEALSAFLSQYYLNAERGKSRPHCIYVSHHLSEKSWFSSVFSQKWGYKVRIEKNEGGEQKKWLQIASTNAKHALETRVSDQLFYENAFMLFQRAFHLSEQPQRMECFDISHTQGEATVGSCVVFGSKGPITEDYRRFSIKNITKGDDYAAMKQVLNRHYTHLKIAEKTLPNIIIVDGGKGQLAKAEEILKELQIDSGILLMGIAKGPTRKAGFETIFVSGHSKPVALEAHEQVLHLIQRIRDEAHRFAITGHRKQRAKTRNTSRLEEISGIGPKKRTQLLRLFGGLQGVLNATPETLCKVPGIDENLARRIYESLHGGEPIQ